MTTEDHAFISLVLVWLIALLVAAGVERIFSKLPKPRVHRRTKK